MKIMCTGANGNLGQALVRLGVIPFEANVLEFDEVRQEMLSKSPDVLIHLVSPHVDIDDYEKAYKLAIRGTSNVIDNQVYPNVKTVYISSAHVFDGKKGKYRETAKPNPINDYGLCKLAAEQVASISGAKIIRLSTCFSDSHNEIESWYNHMTIEPVLGFEVPTFLRRNYAHIDHIAKGVMEFAERWLWMPSILHIAGTEDLSQYEFALACAAHFGWDKRLIEPRTKEQNIAGQAKRPHKATLNVNLARKYGIPLFSAYQGIDLL